MKPTLIAIAFGLACSICGQAQERNAAPEPTSTTVEVGAAIRHVDGDKSFGLQRTSDIPRGLILRRFDFRYLEEGKPLRFTFWSYDLLQKDMLFEGALEDALRYKLSFDWQGFARFWSSENPILQTESSRATYTVPLALRTGLQNATGAEFQRLVGNAFATAPQQEIRAFRDRNTVRFSYNLTDSLTFHARYLTERRSGRRPWSYGVFAGSFERGSELPMPTPYLTNEITTGLDYSKGNLLLGFEYRGSVFTNRAPALTFENWLRADPIGSAPSAQRGLFGVGQAAMPPSNQSHNFTFRGLLLLPGNSRASALLSYGRWTQDEALLPYTINSAVTQSTLPPGTDLTSPSALPVSSYNGLMTTLTQDYAFVTRPWKPLQLTVRYNDYDLNNQSPEIRFPGRVGYNDAEWATTAGGYPASPISPALAGHSPTSKPRAFRRQQTDAVAAIRPTRDITWKSGYRFERYTRERREVDLSREHGFHTTFTYAPKSPLYAQASYRYFHRSPDFYDAVQSHPDWYRMWEQGQRVRRQASGLLSYNFSPGTAFSANWFNGSDRFDRSLYGLHQMQLNSVNADFTWTKSEALSMFFGWGYDRSGFDYTLVANTGAYNFANSFHRDNREGVHFAQFGLSGAFMGERGEYTLTYAGALARTDMTTANPFPIATPGSAAANPFPTVRNQIHEVRFNTTIAIQENIRLGLNYLHEPYRLNDFTQDIVEPYIPGRLQQDVSQYAFNGLPLRNYSGNVLAVYLRYNIR
jgi:hypothetical protein